MQHNIRELAWLVCILVLQKHRRSPLPAYECPCGSHVSQNGNGLFRRHLDADEAIVLGAGLFAANLSTTFRLRKFGMSDGAAYPLAYRVRVCGGRQESPERLAGRESESTRHTQLLT